MLTEERLPIWWHLIKSSSSAHHCDTEFLLRIISGDALTVLVLLSSSSLFVLRRRGVEKGDVRRWMSLQRDTGWFYLSFSSRHDLTPVYSEAEISNGRIAIERNLSTELKNEPNVSQRTRGSSRWSAELSACSCSSFIDRNDAVCHYSDSYIVENIFFHCLSNSLNMRTLVTNQRGSFPSFSRTVCAIVSQPRIWKIHHHLSARTSDTQACDNIALKLLSGHGRQYLTRFVIKFAVPTIMNTAFHHAETLPEDGATLSPLLVIEECSQKRMQPLCDQYRVWGVEHEHVMYWIRWKG